MSNFFVLSQFVLLGVIATFGSVLVPDLTIIIQLFAVVLAVWAMKEKSFKVNIFPEPTEEMSFIQTGPYRLVRHPMYTSLIILGAVWTYNSPSIISIVALVGLIMILWNKSKYEEAFLRAKYGELYDSYHTRVGRFIPKISKTRSKK
ncbi:isoprenylcysteine carboxylmethyltransferase family protein [Candidatus Nomurabacteria bacterium]|uniref:Isoprenylcysteine carboxylmethyltransferase family protein n=1 Tax=Candidatus Dojkabacteria bacterium TaxID=2099670 RepID=A0A955I1K4_9BACT|nr:isoprenylcysteine carboxylmethyltransferase family protein [Candidatus Dojkabacteria bacterium]MCB9789509.1 isoprenylcysteine carboxylmethyltransferase family protein [Candidatus Nomurabacteria bacterium]